MLNSTTQENEKPQADHKAYKPTCICVLLSQARLVVHASSSVALGGSLASFLFVFFLYYFCSAEIDLDDQTALGGRLP